MSHRRNEASRSNLIATPFTFRIRRHLLGAAAFSAIGLSACSLGSATDSASSNSTPTLLSLTSGSLQTGTVGGKLANPIVLKVVDQFGFPSKGVVVSVTTNATSGTVTPTSAATDSTGSVSIVWTLGNSVGTDSLTATAPGLVAVTALAVAHAGQPATVSVVSGSGQTARAGTLLTNPLVLKVVDQYGNPVPNATVLWTTDSNGTFAATTETTDAFGIAQNTFTLGPSTGRQNIVAVVVASGSNVLIASMVATGT